jgi:catechol 2,3-dioxygenase-like lactoylglutathione lyase family enzyme
MIDGAHIILYSRDPEADRAFFRDVLQFDSVDAGHGWLIFALPPAEAAFGRNMVWRNKAWRKRRRSKRSARESASRTVLHVRRHHRDLGRSEEEKAFQSPPSTNSDGEASLR